MKAREQAVEIARSWIGTPYVLRGRVKGAGVDCGTLLLEYLVEIGAAPADEILPLYASDWFCHTRDQRYMLHLMKFAAQIAEGICRGSVNPEAGNLILFKHTHKSEIYTHGAIALPNWPRVIHAEYSGVHESTATSHTLMAFKPMAIFDPWRAA